MDMVLSPTDIKRIKTRACELDFHEFVTQAWDQVEPGTPFKDGWHILAICRHLEAVTRGEIKDLLVNVPPGCMKSLLTCVFWPAWVWTFAPERRFLFASYGEDLSVRDSMKCRNLIESRWYQSRWFYKFRLAKDQNQKTKFENSKTGWRIATSIGGRGTGEHPDYIVADDPHNVKQSESDTERQNALDWWDGTISSRGLTRQSARVVIMQRLHELDLSGHWLKKDPSIVHLMLPMEFEPSRRCTTKIGWRDPREMDGELLWPDGMNAEAVAKVKQIQGSYRAAGQLQQRPSPMGGGMFKRHWFEIVPAAPAHGKRVRMWDLAATRPSFGSDPDWSTGLRMAKDKDGVFYIEDVRRMQETSLVVERAIINTASADGRGVHIGIPQDPGQAGKAQVAYFVRKLAGYVVKTHIERRSKVQRVDLADASFIAQCEAGNVKLVRGPWNDTYLDELEVFPNGAHDDQVDPSANAFMYLVKGGMGAGMVKVGGV